MHPIVENILDRPASHKIAGWVFVLLLIGFLFWQYFYFDKTTELAEVQDKISSLQTEIATERRLARNLDKFRAEVKQLDEKLQIALRQLPDKSEIPDFLEQMENLARDAGLVVNLFRRSPERFKEFYAEVPVAVQVEGTYHQVATFFDEIGRLSRIVNINEIAVRQPQVEPDQVRVSVDCTATAFRYLDESERIQKPEEEGKKRRRTK